MKNTMKKTSFVALMASSILNTEAWAFPHDNEADLNLGSSQQRRHEPSPPEDENPQKNEAQKVMQLQNAIQKIERIMNEGLAHLSLNPDTQSVVIVGESGSGKSTISNHLAGRQLCAAKTKRGNFLLYTQDPLPNSTIGHGSNSETKMPGIWYDPQNNLVIIDCPGLDDTGTSISTPEEEDIKNAFAIQKSFESPSKTKILLTIKEEDLEQEGRIRKLPKLLGKLTKMFPKVEQLKKGLFLAITKGHSNLSTPNARPLQLEDYLERAREKENIPALFIHNKGAKEIFDFIFSDRNIRERVFYYPSPIVEGAYTLDRQQILNQIRQTGPIQNIEFKKDVGPKARDLAVKLAKKTNESLIDYIKTEGAQQVINYCHTLIDGWEGPVQTLRQQLTSVKVMLDSLMNKTAEEFAETLRLSNFFDVGKIRITINQLTFLKDLNETVTHSVNDWAAGFYETIKQIEELVKVPQVAFEKQVLSIKGTLVGTSDIKKALKKYNNAIQIDVNSLNTLLIDKDITKHGRSFSFIAPHWVVVGARTIDLSGDNGIPYPTATQGIDGLPGNLGGNGGPFYGKGVSFKNRDQLTVHTNGGKGGDGQHGADGAKGLDGKDGNPNSVTKFSSESREWHMNLDTWTQKTYAAQGTDGTSGGNGTKGGAAGLGGYSGHFIFEGIEWNNTGNTKPGENGKDGEIGKGGTGGVHGKHHQGILNSNPKHYNWEGHGGLFGSGYDWKYAGDFCSEKIMGWEVESKHVERGSAPNGNSGDGLNAVGRQTPAAQPVLNPDQIVLNYTLAYQSAAADPLVAPFVKIFPGLPKVISEQLHSADAIQSSIRETAIEIGVPLEMGTTLSSPSAQ